MNRKAAFILDSEIFYVLTLILVGILFTVLALIMRSATAPVTDYPEGLEDYFVQQRLFECFRRQPDLAIAWDDATKENLARCADPKFGAKVTLKSNTLTKELTTEKWNPSKVTREQRHAMRIEQNGIVSDGTVTVEMHDG